MICGVGFAQDRQNEYGKNVLAIAPIAATDQGVGFGLSYERTLDSRGMVSFSLPATFSFNVYDEFDWASQNEATLTDYMMYFYPGVKIYPTGAFGVVRYAVGPTLVIGVGEQYEHQISFDDNYVYPPPTCVDRIVAQNRFLIGAMVNNSLNINPTERLHLGLDFGLGMTYYNKRGNWHEATQALVQAAFKIGYRF